MRGLSLNLNAALPLTIYVSLENRLSASVLASAYIKEPHLTAQGCCNKNATLGKALGTEPSMLSELKERLSHREGKASHGEASASLKWHLIQHKQKQDERETLQAIRPRLMPTLPP